MNAQPPSDRIDERHLRHLLEATGHTTLRLSGDGSEVRRLDGGGPLGEAEGQPEDWLGRAVPEEERQRLGAELRAAVAAGQPFAIEHRAIRADGRPGWVRLRGVPVRGRDGAPEEWLAAAEDVTERRQAEESARAREERLNLALDIAGLSTWDWDLETGEVAWSEGHYALQGYTPGEVTPSYEAWKSRVYPQDLTEAEARIREAQEGDGLYEAEFRVLPGNGGLRWCRARGRFLRDAAGRPVRMVGVMQDISAVREGEQRQRALMGELQHRVRNNLAVIRSIVRRGVRSAEGVEDYAAQLEGRIGALARVQSAAARATGHGLDLEGLLRDELQAACASEAQLAISGPALRLPLRPAEMMALAFHELTTNALQHGALAAAGGRIEVAWTLEADEPPLLRLRWRESAVGATDLRGPDGFGTELLERVLPYNLGARTRLDRGPGGFSCEIELPLSAP